MVDNAVDNEPGEGTGLLVVVKDAYASTRSALCEGRGV